MGGDSAGPDPEGAFSTHSQLLPPGVSCSVQLGETYSPGLVDATREVLGVSLCKVKDAPPPFCCSSVSERTLRSHHHMEGK